MTTQVLCDSGSIHLKTYCRQRWANLQLLAFEVGALSTDLSVIHTYNDDTIMILIETVVIMYIKVKLLYINIFIRK